MTAFESPTEYANPRFYDRPGDSDSYHVIIFWKPQKRFSVKQVKKKVLCIEQNPSLGFVIKTILNESFLVKVVPNAFDAMDEFTKSKINCIILTLEKENAQSLTFFYQLSSSSLLKNIPTIVISDYDDNRLKAICRKIEVAKFIKKPFDPIRLSEMVKSLSNKVDTSQVLSNKRKILNLN